MEHTLSAYEDAIIKWNDYRTNSETLLNLLTNGSYFEISRAMYDSWIDASPQNIHAYVGVDTSEGEKLGFILIDSVCDGDPSKVLAENISYAPYCEGFDVLQNIPEFINDEDPNNNITVLTALERSFRWMLNRKKYIENEVLEGGGEAEGMFQAFHIPMSDLDVIFADGSTNNALVIIGLMEDNTTAELILWDENFNEHQTVEDIALPIPPFIGGDYCLLEMALNL